MEQLVFVTQDRRHFFLALIESVSLDNPYGRIFLPHIFLHKNGISRLDC